MPQGGSGVPQRESAVSRRGPAMDISIRLATVVALAFTAVAGAQQTFAMQASD